MKRILILVEGQTEETFVRDILEPHLLPKGLSLTPTLVVTKRLKTGGSFKGGILHYEQAKGDLRRLLRDSNAT